MSRYKVLLDKQVSVGDDTHGQGDEFEHQFDDATETAYINAGLLELLPSEYKVTGPSRVSETDPGDTFEAAYTVGQRDLLVAGGFIEPVQPAPAPPKRTAKKEAK